MTEKLKVLCLLLIAAALSILLNGTGAVESWESPVSPVSPIDPIGPPHNIRGWVAPSGSKWLVTLKWESPLQGIATRYKVKSWQQGWNYFPVTFPLEYSEEVKGPRMCIYQIWSEGPEGFSRDVWFRVDVPPHRVFLPLAGKE